MLAPALHKGQDVTLQGMSKRWPFPDPEDTAAFTTRPVLEQGLPILLVTHDRDDGAWQFLCGTTNDPKDGRIIHLGHLVERDPSIAELADLPLGWQAVREDPQAPWERYHEHLDEEEEAASERQVIDDVERVGWHCIQVEPSADVPPDDYSFQYTVGLEASFEHPELIVLDLPSEVGWSLLDVAVAEIRDGRPLEAGEEYATLLEGGARVAVRDVPTERRLDHLTYADWYYDRRGFRALQLVWPDSRGNLPGQPGYPAANPDQALRDQKP